MKKFLVCAAMLAAMVFTVSCGGGDGGSDNNEQGGNGGSQICNYGQYKCDGGNSYVCGYMDSGNDLTWKFSEQCSNGCDSWTGKCSTASSDDEKQKCTDGTYACLSDLTAITLLLPEYSIIVCRSGEWHETGEVCQNGCYEEDHVFSSKDKVCKQSDGGNNEGGNNNPNGESEGENNNQNGDTEVNCNNGDYTCSGDARLKCQANDWVYSETCANGCSNGECNSCTPQCSGKECGLDGCGGTCGSCDSGYDCSPAGSCLRNNSCSTHLDCLGDGMICYQGFCQSPWNKKWKVTFTSAKVTEKNKDGEAWDALGGLPDLVALMRINGEEVFRTNEVSNSTSAEWNKSATIDFAASTDTIRYHLFDADAFGGGSSSDDDTWLDSTNDEIFNFDHELDLFTYFDQNEKEVCYWDNGVTVEFFCITLEPAW